jgi:hypothetical protein
VNEARIIPHQDMEMHGDGHVTRRLIVLYVRSDDVCVIDGAYCFLSMKALEFGYSRTGRL